MKISHISVKNFKSIKKLNLDGLPKFSVLIGENGVGKSNLMSVFPFLRDCVVCGNINEVVGQIGIGRLWHNGNTKLPIEIAITFGDGVLNVIKYSIKIVCDNHKAVVEDEKLIGLKNNYEIHNRRGVCAIGGNVEHIDNADAALSIFGRIPRYKSASIVYNFLKNVRVANIETTVVRSGFPKDSRRISCCGDDLKSVALNMQEKFPILFNSVREQMRRALGITSIKLKKLPMGNIALLFAKDKKIIPEWEISDGTLILFAHYVLLEQPLTSSILCVETPNLSHKNLVCLAEAMRLKARAKNSQILSISHSPGFISALRQDEVFYVVMEENNTIVKPLRGNKEIESCSVDIPLSELYSNGFIDAVM